VRVRRSEPGDAEFLLEMARLACGLEDRSLPSTDAPDVLALLPASTDVALIATDNSGDPLGATTSPQTPCRTPVVAGSLVFVPR
jgi:hypothetical protein